MVVDLEIDATLGNGFYYYCFFYSQEELGRFYKAIFTIILKKAITLAQFQGSEMSPKLF